MSARRDHPAWRTRPGRGSVRLWWCNVWCVGEVAQLFGRPTRGERARWRPFEGWRRCPLCGVTMLPAMPPIACWHCDRADRPLRPRTDNHYPELPVTAEIGR